MSYRKSLGGMNKSTSMTDYFFGDYLLPQMNTQDPIFTPHFSIGADAGHATFKYSIAHIHRLGES